MSGRGFAPVAGALAATWGLALAAGCASIGTRPAPVPVPTEAPPVETGEFTVAENMLDTWNTIGKILVALQGVTYEGRSQMLGLYTVRYRGEPFLIRTQAVAIGALSPGVSTRVDALDSQGKPFSGPAAVALLRILAERIPREVAQYRQPVKLPDAAAKKRRRPL